MTTSSLCSALIIHAEKVHHISGNISLYSTIQNYSDPWAKKDNIFEKNAVTKLFGSRRQEQIPSSSFWLFSYESFITYFLFIAYQSRLLIIEYHFLSENRFELMKMYVISWNIFWDFR